ncbi:Rossmann-like domain-containing protein [Ideonella sp. A 288]|uniref:Rossmann-like domain-containing protein n=1 Tax=Ideonella sp. A 288 TaxID=1962181 RepID=UPI000B4B1BB6|nr:DUF364 domain-containing protein [Ideonella sp. A 288]
MTLADDLLAQLKDGLAGPAPRVRALHLPPRPWNGTKDGEFCAIELDDGSLGLSYVLLDDTLARLASAGSDRQVVGADALELAGRWRDGRGAERALGFAAVNALSRHLLDRAGRVPPDATDAIGGLDPQPGEHIGMVGLFPPLVRRVTACGARLTVLELREDLAGARADFTVSLDPAALADCDKVLTTSTVLLNDTLDAILAACSRARQVAMIGPGAGCLPEALFARGVTAVGGAWIVDRPGFVAALTRGEPWGGCARKTLWTAAQVPRQGARPAN